MSSAMEGLTAEQLKFWDENGFLVIPDALSPETTDALLAESHKLIEGSHDFQKKKVQPS